MTPRTEPPTAILSKQTVAREPLAEPLGAKKPMGALETFQRRLRRRLALLLLSGFALVAAGTLAQRALAQEAEPLPGSSPVKVPGMTDEERNREAESIARTIMSPFCEGRTISSCPVAGPWREDIRKWVGEGVDADEIRRRLAARVPDRDLNGAPPNRLGAALPIGSALIAVGALVFILKRLVRPSQPAQSTSANGAEPAAPKPEPAPPGGEDYDARLADELETLER